MIPPKTATTIGRMGAIAGAGHEHAVGDRIGSSRCAVFPHVTAASAAEVNVLSARAIATVLNEIGSDFEQTSGHKLNVMSGLPSEFIKHIDGGAPVDLVVSGSAPVDRLVQDGKLVAGTRIDLVRSGIGVGVRAGAPKPDISSVEAFKCAL